MDVTSMNNVQIYKSTEFTVAYRGRRVPWTIWSAHNVAFPGHEEDNNMGGRT